MPTSCCVIGCKSWGYKKGRKYSAFPMLQYRSAKRLALSQARQKAWCTAINRAGFGADKFKHARVCDLHFVSGKSVTLSKVDDVDWVPTLNMGYTLFKPEHSGENSSIVSVKMENIEEDEQSMEMTVVTPDIFNLSRDPISSKGVDVVRYLSKETQTNIPISSISIQTEITVSTTGTQTDPIAAILPNSF
ncbi:hypothetical protein HA402_001289 [Bradysia odoriphaga]|nr:hypothetical protein HA402_001289 [Bradysia odoriphaga]